MQLIRAGAEGEEEWKSSLHDFVEPPAYIYKAQAELCLSLCSRSELNPARNRAANRAQKLSPNLARSQRSRRRSSQNFQATPCHALTRLCPSSPVSSRLFRPISTSTRLIQPLPCLFQPLFCLFPPLPCLFPASALPFFRQHTRRSLQFAAGRDKSQLRLPQNPQ